MALLVARRRCGSERRRTGPDRRMMTVDCKGNISIKTTDILSPRTIRHSLYSICILLVLKEFPDPFSSSTWRRKSFTHPPSSSSRHTTAPTVRFRPFIHTYRNHQQHCFHLRARLLFGETQGTGNSSRRRNKEGLHSSSYLWPPSIVVLEGPVWWCI